MSANRVWIRKAGKFVAVVESPQEVRWTRRYNQLGTFFMRVHRAVDGAEHLTDAMGDEISVVDTPGATVPDLTFVIESVQFRVKEGGLVDDILEIRGTEAGLFHMRIALPPPHALPLGTQTHHTISGDAESAMREIVDKNVGPSADADRQYPGLVLDTNQNRGVTKNWKARFERVHERLNTWAQTSELGYEVQYDAAADEHVFKVLSGEDKSDSVEFSMRMDNVDAQEWTVNGADQISFAYVAGQGTGAERDMEGVHTGASEPTGKDRRELFIDARDLESSADLPTRGEEALAARQIEESFVTDVDADGAFVYKTDWDLGDTVTVKNEAWDFSKTQRVVEVQTVVKNNEVRRNVTLGKAPKDIQTRVAEQIGDQATARSVVVDQDKHPEGQIVGIRDTGSGNFATASDDRGKLITGNDASARTCTISANTHSQHDTFYIKQRGAGQITVQGDSGVSLEYADGFFDAKTLGQNAIVTVICEDDTGGAEVFSLGGQLALAT